MELKFKEPIAKLKARLNKKSVQDVLLDLAYLVKGKQYLKNEWQEAVEQVMSRIADVVPSDAVFAECDSKHDEDGMFLINHDPNYINYAYDYDDVGNSKHFKPVSVADTSKIINYVNSHMKDLKTIISYMDDSYYKTLV